MIFAKWGMCSGRKPTPSHWMPFHKTRFLELCRRFHATTQNGTWKRNHLLARRTTSKWENGKPRGNINHNVGMALIIRRNGTLAHRGNPLKLERARFDVAKYTLSRAQAYGQKWSLWYRRQRCHTKAKYFPFQHRNHRLINFDEFGHYELNDILKPEFCALCSNS